MNYMESEYDASVRKWRRISLIEIFNEDTPRVVAHVENIREIETEGDINRISEYVAAREYVVGEPMVEIPLIDENFEPTEQTITVGQVQRIVASFALWMDRQAST